MAEPGTKHIGQATERNKDHDVEHNRLERLREIGLVETFPASDAVAVIQPAPREKQED